MVYTLVFGVILKARWGFSGGTANYALMLFAGLIVFNAFAECLVKAPSLIRANPNFVKKIVFPLELIGIGVWLIGYSILFGAPKPTVILFPLILACFFPVLLGVGWLFSAVGIIVRDIDQVTSLISHALLFLTPIFYTVDAIPAAFQALMNVNPLTFIVEQLRLVLFGELPSMMGLALYLIFSSLFAWLSLLVFNRLRSGFADMV